MFLTLKTAVAAIALSAVAGTAFARDLVINFDDLNPGPKKGFEDAVAQFKAENPDINVIVNINDREA
ncbi:MAG: carbohydrate ABC transporter substrate-binding protein, partial [Pseudomonadota bacterium]